MNEFFGFLIYCGEMTLAVAAVGVFIAPAISSLLKGTK